MTYADHDQSGDSLLVAHFGTMSAAARAKFAARVERTGGPVAILDDAALAYLAARGNRQLGVAMSILMPFAAVNPYIRMKRGAVADGDVLRPRPRARAGHRPRRHAGALRRSRAGQVRAAALTPPRSSSPPPSPGSASRST